MEASHATRGTVQLRASGEPESDNPWLRRLGPAPAAATRLVCLPHAGGAASYYAPFARDLAPALDVVAVQYPGRQERHRERPFDELTRLIDAVFALRTAWAGRPYAFFGHSMGAIVAFELARRLAEAGEPGPVRLYVSGRRSPSSRRVETVHLRGDAAFAAELRRLGGTDPRFLDDPELLAMILPAARADYRAIETYEYRPGPPLACPVTVFTGDADPNTTVEEADAWREHTTGPFALEVFPGGHFFLDRHRDDIVRVLTAELAGAGWMDGDRR